MSSSTSPHSSGPQHVAIIPDGNRRWAKTHHLDTLAGHQYVAEKIIPALIKHAIKRRLSYLTFWLFSRENWQRSSQEVDGLLNLFYHHGLKQLVKSALSLDAQVKFLGRLTDFSPELKKVFTQAQAQTAHCQTITVNLALSYSGRDELVRAFQQILTTHPSLSPAEINEELITAHLDTAGLPDPELIIRTSGEQRLSGLFPWQSVYSEFYFTSTQMPDFTVAEFDQALAEYAARQRRFGH
jgi:undecaprenyl diphosphate synthase